MLRKSLFSILPLTLISSVPARILIFGLGWNYLLWQLLISIIILSLTRVVWKVGIKKYESASS
jgi:ABC-type uncharacterized transport system permease subunit